MYEPASVSSATRFDRRTADRRSTTWRSLVFGGVGKNRRRGPRRWSDRHGYYVDWYETRLLVVSLGIFLLCCTDALFTLTLLDRGAEEVNLFMAYLIDSSVEAFVAIKVGFTAVGLVFLVMHSTFRLLGVLPVKHVLLVLLGNYVVLFVYQVGMLSGAF